MGLGDFAPEQLASYRRCWRERGFIFGSTADYRAAAEVDLRLDQLERGHKVDCPALVVWGERGIGRLFDMEELWSERLSQLRTASLPSGHFFVDELPAEVTRLLRDFLVLTVTT